MSYNLPFSSLDYPIQTSSSSRSFQNSSTSPDFLGDGSSPSLDLCVTIEQEHGLDKLLAQAVSCEARLAISLTWSGDPRGEEFGSKVTPWVVNGSAWSARSCLFRLTKAHLGRQVFLDSAKVNLGIQVGKRGGDVQELASVGREIRRILVCEDAPDRSWICFDDDLRFMVKLEKQEIVRSPSGETSD